MQQTLNQMFNLAKQAALNAYVPFCKFQVGVCLRTKEGKLFNGCNWENASTPLGQCAEASAISAMITAGYRKITDIVLVAPKLLCTPCGGCRQRLIQFSNPNTTFYAYNMDNELLYQANLFSLLPEAFIWKPN